MSLLIPKIINKDSVKEIIKSLTNEQTLQELVMEDNNHFVLRQIAVKQITDNSFLKEIVLDSSSTDYTDGLGVDIKEIAVSQINDDDMLFEIVNSFYDDTVVTKYGLNIVKMAICNISNDNMLIDISESKYDEEVVQLAVDELNTIHQDHDKVKLTVLCNDDSKAKRLSAIHKINDDTILLDIAMNGDYLDVREEALDKISSDDEIIVVLRDLIDKEKDYQNESYNIILSGEPDDDVRRVMFSKAKDIVAGYAKIGVAKKVEFYQNECSFYEV